MRYWKEETINGHDIVLDLEYVEWLVVKDDTVISRHWEYTEAVYSVTGE